MKVNGQEIIGKFFAYEGCHKMYILETEQDIKEAEASVGYDVVPIDQLPHVWDISCELRFIRNWKTDKVYVKQFEQAVFEP
jgi:hypothetical protein